MSGCGVTSRPSRASGLVTDDGRSSGSENEVENGEIKNRPFDDDGGDVPGKLYDANQSEGAEVKANGEVGIATTESTGCVPAVVNANE